MNPNSSEPERFLSFNLLSALSGFNELKHIWISYTHYIY